jgi:hypothetical protein
LAGFLYYIEPWLGGDSTIDIVHSTVERVLKMKFPESRLQAKAVLEIRMRYPWMIFWHTPNGGRRSLKDGVRFKMMGTRPGVADLTFLRAARGFFGLYIEVKAGKGRLSEDQLFFESKCIDEGYLYICENTVQGILDAVRWYYETD